MSKAFTGKCQRVVALFNPHRTGYFSNIPYCIECRTSERIETIVIHRAFTLLQCFQRVNFTGECECVKIGERVNLRFVTVDLHIMNKTHFLTV